MQRVNAMTDIKISNLTNYEQSTLKQEVDGDNAGSGVLYTGKYHVLIYYPLKDQSTYKCTGVTLMVRKIENSDQSYAPQISIPFKQS
jgi:hypothetical protein